MNIATKIKILNYLPAHTNWIGTSKILTGETIYYISGLMERVEARIGPGNSLVCSTRTVKR